MPAGLGRPSRRAKLSLKRHWQRGPACQCLSALDPLRPGLVAGPDPAVDPPARPGPCEAKMNSKSTIMIAAPSTADRLGWPYKSTSENLALGPATPGPCPSSTDPAIMMIARSGPEVQHHRVVRPSKAGPRCGHLVGAGVTESDPAQGVTPSSGEGAGGRRPDSGSEAGRSDHLLWRGGTGRRPRSRKLLAPRLRRRAGRRGRRQRGGIETSLS